MGENKTILVTGGAGFIGSHLCEALLNKGYSIINVDNFCDFYSPLIKQKNIQKALKNPNYTLEKVDIRDKDGLSKVFKNNKIDIVVHLAAMAGVRPSIENPILYNEVNVAGTLNLLEECKEKNIKKFIFASSSSVYGNNKKTPFKETDIVDFTISPYAYTKKSGEIMCHTYHHLYNINMICLRFFTVYGERQRPDLAIHKFTKMIDNGEALPFFGNGNTERDYTYIGDIIDGIIKTIYLIDNNENVYDIFNLGESETITLKEMVNTLENIIGKKAIINKLPLQIGDIEKTYADIDKAKKILDYNPKTNFKEGISKFIKWYSENK